MTTYFQMTSERAAEIAACDTTLTPEIVTEYALADWNEGEEHQRWLDEAPAQEIADWVVTNRN